MDGYIRASGFVMYPYVFVTRYFPGILALAERQQISWRIPETVVYYDLILNIGRPSVVQGSKEVWSKGGWDKHKQRIWTGRSGEKIVFDETTSLAQPPKGVRGISLCIYSMHVNVGVKNSTSGR